MVRDDGALVPAIACVITALVLYGLVLLVLGGSDEDEALGCADRPAIVAT